MDIEERLNILEKDFTELKEELKELLLDIRSYLMEAQNPLKAYEGKMGLNRQTNEKDKGKTQDKGVTENGNRD
jgi:hypothetical protein